MSSGQCKFKARHLAISNFNPPARRGVAHTNHTQNKSSHGKAFICITQDSEYEAYGRWRVLSCSLPTLARTRALLLLSAIWDPEITNLNDADVDTYRTSGSPVGCGDAWGAPTLRATYGRAHLRVSEDVYAHPLPLLRVDNTRILQGKVDSGYHDWSMRSEFLERPPLRAILCVEHLYGDKPLIPWLGKT
ncbi:hypothetical protein BDZ97DRAFT_1757947 [Flammula alnicola]|nr:hypothetical protein BDZ97DRAFT_1757947 [Flammula alnicola]